MLDKGVSIILCTYNGKSRLSKTLMHLAKQKINIACEIIFVDNASTDGTKTYADTWWQNNGNPNITYSSFIEPIPGKSNAQDLGYKKAKYNYLLVCDDDNWLSDTYVQTAFNIINHNPEIGALGGWCEAVFETQEPSWFATYCKYYAVSQQGKASGDITNQKGCLYGAGMVINKTHWLQLKSMGFQHLLSCRKGNKLSSGGDTEYSYALRLLGYKIWYDERLYFKHYMTQSRLQLKYLSRLRKAMSYSNFVLWSYTDLLKNEKRNWNKVFRKGKKGVLKEWYNNIKVLIHGDDFEEKEQAKAYFRNLYYIFLKKSTYKKNQEFILSWLKNKDS